MAREPSREGKEQKRGKGGVGADLKLGSGVEPRPEDPGQPGNWQVGQEEWVWEQWEWVTVEEASGLYFQEEFQTTAWRWCPGGAQWAGPLGDGCASVGMRSPCLAGCNPTRRMLDKHCHSPREHRPKLP